MQVGAVADWATGLAEKAEWSAANRQLEADVRSDIFSVLGPYATQALGMDPADIRQEGTGRSGRFDSMFGRFIVEYKRPHLLESDTERAAAARQAVDYLEDEALGAEVVVVTDGSTWGLLRDEIQGPESGEQAWLDLGAGPLAPIDRFAWRRVSRETADRVLVLMATVRRAPVSVGSLISRLGPRRPETIRLLGQLGVALAERESDSRTDILFRQWLELAGVAYGIENAKEAWPASPDEVLGAALSPALAGFRYAEAVFVLHTYIAFASKIIATELLALISGALDARPTQWISLTGPQLAEQLVKLESGQVTEALRAGDFVSADLFGWYAPELSDNSALLDSVRAVLLAFEELAWARLANARGVAGDLLRDFYAALVPPKMRKALGEFFTPRWIAERLLTRAISLAGTAEGPVRILDPACGSGTFLVAALRRALAMELAREGVDEATAVQSAVDSVIGFDINPVAVLMARVNLLLALGERATLLPSISFNVYETDSILLPDRIVGQTRIGDPEDVRRLPLTIGNIDLPPFVASAQGLRLLRDNMETGVRNNRSPERFRGRILTDLRRLPGWEDDDAVLDAITSVYARVLELAREGRDGVWARVIEEAFVPGTIDPVDIVIGNPPWISWKHVPQAWQERSRHAWEMWGMWQTRTRGGGTPLADISSLLLARSVSTYCRPGGVVAFLLPQSVLIADPGSRAIRRCFLGGASESFSEAKAFRPLAVDDFSDLSPFAPDAATRPVALYLRPGEAAEFPFELVSWQRARARLHIPSTTPWVVAEVMLNATATDIQPLDERDVSSPWVRAAEPDALRLKSRSAVPAYRWGQGFHTRGADGLFAVEVLSPRPLGPSRLARIRSVPSAGSNTQGESVREAEVEADFLWPLMRGQNVQTLETTSSGLYMIVAHDPSDLAKVLSVDELAQMAPKLYDYLEPWIERLAQRSPYGELQPSAERPWGIQGPWAHLRRNGCMVLSRYMHPQKRPPAAVAVAEFDEKLGITTTVYPNNKCNFVQVGSESEAWYLAALLNSELALSGIARFVSSTTIAPSALERLPVPLFDRECADHRNLAVAAEKWVAEPTEENGSRLRALTAEVWSRAV